VACFWGMQNHQPGSANRAQGVSARSFFSKFSEKEFFSILASMRSVPPDVDNRSLAVAAQNQRFRAARASKRYAGQHTGAWRFGVRWNVLP
jgi:hypothetical protein